MKLFSVTEVLRPFSNMAYESIPATFRDDVLSRASARGTYVHQLCAAFAQGLPVYEESLPEEILGYFVSFKKWHSLRVKALIFCEQRLENPDLGYFGHPDFGFMLEDHSALVDIKTPAVASRSWPIQTSAYLDLASHNGIALQEAFALQLFKNGSMAKAVAPYQSHPAHFGVFLQCLNAYRYFNS